MQGQQVSHYRLTDKLGAGTYGEVWKGVHVDRSNFTVAVKLIAPQVREDPAFLEALERECVALDRLDHPSIVRFRELVVREGTVAMVLELLEGADLEALLAAGPQPVDEVVRILDKVLDGLAYAHSEGVIHRDIKPGNIFRCSNGRVKLMDFGIARAADGTQATQTGTLKGTLDYMAPERFANQTTPASDVYAVGLVAWELLAGRRAAPAGELAAKLGWHMGVGLPDVRTQRPDCPVWLAEVVATLGSKDVAARPADGAAALALLRSRSGGVDSSTGPVTPAPVAPGTVSLSAAAVAASLPPAAPSTVPGTVSLPAGASVPPSAPPTGPTPTPQTVAVPAGSLPPVASEVDLPEPEPSSGNGKVLGAVAAVLVLGVGGWFAKGELDRRAALEAAYQSAVSADSISDWQAFLLDYPAHPRRVEAEAALEAAQEAALEAELEAAYQEVAMAGSIADWQAFLADYPEHPRKGEAEAALSKSIEAEHARTGIADWMSIPGGSMSIPGGGGSLHGDSFELMKSEVTVSQYRKCVDAGKCTEPDDKSDSKYCNWGHSGREKHPINCVDWNQATTFAAWAGGRLPTEAEWEYAARSGGQSQTYPWGYEEATCSLAVMGDGGVGCGEGRTWPVCSKPGGNSTQDVCDLVGNVWEWVQHSYYDTRYDQDSRVFRGGGWNSSAGYLTVRRRRGISGSSHRSAYLGFRLAR